MTALGWIIIILVVAAILIALAAWFYERATNDVSLVRTGVGRRRVAIDGGILAIPYFHEVSRVNMQTIRMEVVRSGDNSLITKDRLRIDVGAEFYASVVPEPEAITRAAQTLGRRTFQPDQLKSLIDGMMVDALRAVAAQMSMDELHENRTAFAAQVRDALAGTLERYGLQLDSVSLTALDQTPFHALDENNAFNAVGMRKLAEVIAKSKKERAEIEGESQVSVRRAEVEANRRKLEIDLEQRRAEIAQTQEIETLMAQQLTDVARRRAEADRRKQLALIAAEQEAEADAARIRLSVESDKLAAQTRSDIRRGEAETLRIMKRAEADGEAAHIEALNGRSAELAAMEMERMRLDALPKIVGEMVKPAEKIKGISINHITGLGRGSGEGGSGGSPVDQTVEAILDMAVSLPAMKRLGETLGANLEGVLPEDKTRRDT